MDAFKIAVNLPYKGMKGNFNELSISGRNSPFRE
jgi:hypothetical protein